MNNEPVAWMYAVNGIWTAFSDELPPDDAYDEGTLTPLYTHPEKTLTDEEILEIANQCLIGATAWHNPDLDPIEFARAILRKAQEK